MNPGIYLDVPAPAYFADPAPQPSLSQSVAKILLNRSPLHAWHAHPRLNPDFARDDATKYDIGNIAHTLMIGRGKELVVLDAFDDWRTKAAKEAREEAAKEGKLAVLGRHYARADGMVRAAREQLDLRGLGHLFRDGDGEAVMVWQEGPIWLRQMVDWLTPDRRVFADYKTTDMSASPWGLGRMMVNAGWDVQAAFASRGLDTLDPDNAGRRKFLFVVQEAEAPYCLSVVELSEAALTMGRKRVEFAVRMWAECTAADRWPGYSTEIIVPEYPGWAEQQWLDREIADAARARHPQPDNVLLAG